MPLKILIASVTNAPPEILEAHLRSIMWQDAEAEIDHLYITDPEIAPESVTLLDEAGVTVKSAGPKPAEARHSVTSYSHEWSKPTFSWLARERQRLLDHTLSAGYDALWLIDSDLIAAPETLRSLLQTEKPIVSSVFWTHWTPQAPPLPQVWMRHDYKLEGKGLEAHELMMRLAHRDLVQVGGLGASTLIRRRALEKGVAYAPLLQGIPQGGMWEGEDRSFCLRAQRAHIPLWADGWPDLFHIYRPEDVEKIPEMMDTLRERSSLSPKDGDLISAIIEPAEDRRLIGWSHALRGRLGVMKLLPSLSETLKKMQRGDERFVRVRFPMWWPKRELAGTDRSIRLRLLDVKPFKIHPTLSEFEEPVEFITDPFYEPVGA